MLNRIKTSEFGNLLEFLGSVNRLNHPCQSPTLLKKNVNLPFFKDPLPLLLRGILMDKVIKARLNQISLKTMAERHRRHIHASAYRSHLLNMFGHYLSQLIEDLTSKDFTTHELIDLEKDLEAVEAALVHLWIELPYNEALTIVDCLPDAMITRLHIMINKAKIQKRHLRLAYSDAA